VIPPEVATNPLFKVTRRINDNQRGQLFRSSDSLLPDMGAQGGFILGLVEPIEVWRPATLAMGLIERESMVHNTFEI
jgi:hypothetical protein